ncbi:hypothetical protein KC318_g8957 [Hortaea werneckii]|uniref:DNA (cytosine-5-)-methyltransferase n=1 Tax=Hortaea werneckii TaxID=91943 RepID=A0A3M7B035_HORWE|nr:hypothetical protein KC334_g10259 [Hortaea werneckii]KAI7662277.1 hypothetical protein KC318_g8957 [Hortaea werneckii]RMY17527.1 hypothetical protein D0867_05967 [Hortaea werneckii]RMY33112.1 hypothetical protein D0866_06154 [Hortaea werneckii]
MVLRRAAPKSAEVIDLDDDQDTTSSNSGTRGPIRPRETIELDEDDDLIENFSFIDLTEDDGLDGPDYIREATPHFLQDSSPNVPYGYRQINSVQSFAGTLKIGECYDLTDGDFLLVKQIIERPTKRKTSLRGILLRRNRRVNDMLPKKTNEVCMIMKAKSNPKSKLSIEDCLVSRPLKAILTRRVLICTNRPFPDHSFRGVEFYPNLETAAELGVLVCRWKYVEFYDDCKVKEEMLCRLSEAQGDRAKVVPDVMLSRMWRKEEPRDGTRKNEKKEKPDADTIDLVSDDEDEDLIEVRHVRQNVYSYGDICAGAGGVSTGAVQAGLKLNFLLDHCRDACETLKLSFVRTGHCHSNQILCADIHDFCTGQIALGLANGLFRVEILHISFPCQPHSAVHTVPGKDDDANIAAGYSVIPILQKCKPRIVTFEQTSGIVTHRGGYHFRALIHQLTVAGYSARWRIVNMAQYGNVQARKRLIIIAAGPGEVLPAFPPPTHGPPGSGLKPYTTVQDVLAKVPRHNPPHMVAHTTKPHGVPYDPRQPLKSAITCDGGKSDMHPSGTRSFNMRELSMLQSFPATHDFSGTMTSIRKQCGNAVPSCFAKLMFEEITQSLNKRDREVANWRPEVIALD